MAVTPRRYSRHQPLELFEGSEAMIALTSTTELLIPQGIGILVLWGICYAYAMRVSGREADSLRRSGRLDAAWDDLVVKRRSLGTIALLCAVVLVIGGAALIGIDRQLIAVVAGLVALGLTPAVFYFGFINGTNYVLDNPDDRELMEQRQADKDRRRAERRR